MVYKNAKSPFIALVPDIRQAFPGFKIYNDYLEHFAKMKFSLYSAGLALLASTVLAAPTPTEEEDLHLRRDRVMKRATVTDIATLGYATQNGGLVVIYISVFLYHRREADNTTIQNNWRERGSNHHRLYTRPVQCHRRQLEEQ
jgi:hypothetical protein